MSDTVKAALADGLLRLTLNRPDKLNSFNEEMHLALRAAMQRAHDENGIRAVLLTGAGRSFCAGQDLGDRDPRKDAAQPDLGYTIETFYNPLIRQIRSLDKPIICAVNGVAAGAGATGVANATAWNEVPQRPRCRPSSQLRHEQHSARRP